LREFWSIACESVFVLGGVSVLVGSFGGGDSGSAVEVTEVAWRGKEKDVSDTFEGYIYDLGS